MLPRTLIAVADFCRWWLQLNLTLQPSYHPWLSRLPETLSWARALPHPASKLTGRDSDLFSQMTVGHGNAIIFYNVMR